MIEGVADGRATSMAMTRNAGKTLPRVRDLQLNLSSATREERRFISSNCPFPAPRQHHTTVAKMSEVAAGEQRESGGGMASVGVIMRKLLLSSD